MFADLSKRLGERGQLAQPKTLRLKHVEGDDVAAVPEDAAKKRLSGQAPLLVNFNDIKQAKESLHSLKPVSSIQSTESLTPVTTPSILKKTPSGKLTPSKPPVTPTKADKALPISPQIPVSVSPDPDSSGSVDSPSPSPGRKRHHHHRHRHHSASPISHSRRASTNLVFPLAGAQPAE